MHISTLLWSPLLSVWELRGNAVPSPPVMRVVVVQSVSISVPLIWITCNTQKKNTLNALIMSSFQARSQNCEKRLLASGPRVA